MSNHLVNGYYVALPEKTIDSKEWRSLTPSTRCVYTTMMLKYKRKGDNANGRVKWKQSELAIKVGLSLKTVNTCLQNLKDSKWISVYEPGGRWLDGTTYEMASIYADRQSSEPT